VPIRSLTVDRDADAVPTVDPPDPDTDRGLPDAVGVPVLAFAATLLAMVAIGVVSGDPVTWSDASGVLSNAFTAAGVAAGVRWLFDDD